jgi:hypothetical protein
MASRSFSSMHHPLLMRTPMPMLALAGAIAIVPLGRDHSVILARTLSRGSTSELAETGLTR